MKFAEFYEYFVSINKDKGILGKAINFLAKFGSLGNQNKYDPPEDTYLNAFNNMVKKKI